MHPAVAALLVVSFVLAVTGLAVFALRLFPPQRLIVSLDLVTVDGAPQVPSVFRGQALPPQPPRVEMPQVWDRALPRVEITELYRRREVDRFASPFKGPLGQDWAARAESSVPLGEFHPDWDPVAMEWTVPGYTPAQLRRPQRSNPLIEVIRIRPEDAE